jgi:hypothetical protein
MLSTMLPWSRLHRCATMDACDDVIETIRTIGAAGPAVAAAAIRARETRA